jgi:hypothetical protein
MSWEKAAAKPRYEIFKPALTAGMDKLDMYYQRSAESDAHIMAMGKVVPFIISFFADHYIIVLDPTKKMAYFHKNWKSDLVSKVEETVKTRVSSLLLS